MSAVDSGALTLAQVRVALIQSPEGQDVQDVVRLYQTVFGRVPDKAGLNDQVDTLRGPATEADLANSFANSPEFISRFGGNTVNTAFINAVYQQVLGRTPSAGEVNFYLNSGFSAGRIALAFSESPEFQAATSTAVVGFLDAAGQGTAVYTGSLGGTVNVGTTFTLTAGADTFDGTAQNDTFNALTVNAQGAGATTLSAFDKIDGGAGVDTLNIYADGTNNTELPSSASIKNVETINIFNDGAVFNTGTATTVDTSKFVGATQVWQQGQAGKVVNLAETTTAGFKGVTSTTAAPLTVTAAATAATASIALDSVKGDAAAGAGQNQAALDIAGDALNSVTVSGSLAQAVTTAGAPAASLDLDVIVGKDVQSVSVNSSVSTVLDVTEAVGSTKNVTSVDASSSTGAIQFVGDTATSTIKTGAGNDGVTVATATSNTVGAVVNALVETGAGNDAINVNTSGTGTTTVSAGEGDDAITLTSGVNTATRVDGGEGSDVVKIAGGTFNAEQYVLVSNAISNVETIQFTGATAAVVDASKLSEFGTFSFAGNVGDKVTEASAASIVTAGNIEAYSTGYKADGADADTLTDAYGGNLAISQNGTGTADIFADSASLTVNAGVAGDVTSTVTGDVKALSASLTNGANSLTAPTADTLASVVIDASAAPELQSLTSVTLSGNGSATVVGGDSLVTIDASQLGGTLAYGANKGDITGGLTYTGDATVAETVTVGSGTDSLTVNSTYSKLDTINGFDAAKETVGGNSTTDVIEFSGTTLDGTATGQATKVALSTSATSLELAFVEAAAADSGAGVVFFQFEGNTYLFDNDGTPALNDDDAAVKVTGLVDFADDWGVFAA